MKTHFYTKCSFAVVVLLLLTTNLLAQGPILKGPLDADDMPATISGGITIAEYFTDPGKTHYQWAVSSAGSIAPGSVPESIIVTWTNPTAQQTVSVNYDENLPNPPTVLIINYYPFPASIDPAIIPQFVDPLPHFAAGLRVDAKKGGNLVVKAALTRQIALSTGTQLSTGVIGSDRKSVWVIMQGMRYPKMAGKLLVLSIGRLRPLKQDKAFR